MMNEQIRLIPAHYSMTDPLVVSLGSRSESLEYLLESLPLATEY
jgi:hypothetical protein